MKLRLQPAQDVKQKGEDKVTIEKPHQKNEIVKDKEKDTTKKTNKEQLEEIKYMRNEKKILQNSVRNETQT